MPFVFDTNSIRVLSNYYPQRFPSFWRRFDQLVTDEEVISTREVLRELPTQLTQPWLLDWIDHHKELFVTPGQDETDFVRQIFAVRHFQALVGQKQRLKGTPVADPWVITCAHTRQGCVVTEERGRPNSAKIPNVCEHFGIDCTNLEGFLERLGWRF